MRSTISIFLLSVSMLFSAVIPVVARAEVNAYLFYGEGCPHCAKEKVFLHDVLIKEFPDLRVHEYEVYHDQDNVVLLRRIAEILGVEANGVPFLLIGDRHFVGFSEGVIADEIRAQVALCTTSVCPDPIAPIVGTATEMAPNTQRDPKRVEEVRLVQDGAPTPDTETSLPGENDESRVANIIPITIPFFGVIDAGSISLPLLTIVMGALDGFNPCAMWALVFLIGLLLEMEDRRRMWILGTVFIGISALVYFLFMTAWLHLVMFLGLIVWVRLGIGLLAIGGGIYSLREYLNNKEGTCKVTDQRQKRRIIERMKAVVREHRFLLSVIGIAGLAFAVNLVELVCSAGLPAVYTQVLTLNAMSTGNSYLYILLYIFFFMLDDLLVFVVAMTTLQLTGITTRYVGLSRLIGGIVMLAVGIMLLFRPEWLQFG